MSCTGNKQWYVCSKGDFKGCCSSDPCQTGLCPDSSSESGNDTDSNSSKALTTTAKPEHKAASTTSTTTTTSSSLDSSTLASSSTLSSTQTSTSFPENAAETGGGSMMMDMHGGSSEDMHSYHKSLIAGVITGCVVAVLLLVGIILCMWYRSRKKHGKKITLRQWCGACCGRKYAKTKHDGHANACACACCNPPAPTSEMNPATPVSNANANVNANASVDIGSTIITPGSETTRFLPNSPPSAISSPERQYQPYQSVAAAVPPPLETIPSPTLVYQQNRDKRRRQKTTPELGDTGFYRPRVELETHPQSELINVPPGERTRRHHRIPRPNSSPRPNPSINPGSNRDPARGQPEHIVTSDGVILAANFSRLSPGARDHATSFADVPLGLGFDFSCADQDVMRRADDIAEYHAQDGDVLPAYSESFNYAGKR